MYLQIENVAVKKFNQPKKCVEARASLLDRNKTEKASSLKARDQSISKFKSNLSNSIT